MKHKSKNILIKVWIFLSFLLFSCSTPVSSSAHTAEEHIETSITLQTPQIQMMGIQTSPVLRKNSAATLQARGKVEVPHQNLVQISFPFEGNVQNISVLEGSPVIKNQKLAQIESLSFIELQQAYLENFYQLDYLSLELKRQEELQAQNAGAVKNLQKIKSDYLSLSAKLNGLKAKLNLLDFDLKNLETGHILSAYSLKSPVIGFINQIKANRGSWVKAGETILEIIDTEHLHAEIYVYEKDISLIHLGQKIKIYNTQYPEGLNAQVYLINQEISADRTVKVHAHLSQKDENKLMAGAYLQAKIYLDTQEIDLIPRSALVDFEGKNYIFTPENSSSNATTYTMIQVEIGAIQEEEIQVIFSAETKTPNLVVHKGAAILLSTLKNTQETDHGH